MIKLKKFKRYEYPIEDKKGNKYIGSYTIYNDIKSLNYPNEELVEEFETCVKV